MQKTYPTHVILNEITPDGEEFLYTRQTGELNKALEDLLGKNDYNVKIFLRPMGNVFEITGEIKADRTFDCSRCGDDVDQKINERVQELIVVLKEKPRAGHSGHVGRGESSDGPYCNYVTSNQFDLAEFVHEYVAAAEPYTIYCGKASCDEILKKIQDQSATSGKQNPFADLKNLIQKPQRD